MGDDDAGGRRQELEHDFLDNAKEFKWDAVRTMLKDTPDLINVRPCGRWTALHQAAFEGNSEVCRELMQQGADAKVVNGGRKTPLEVAKGAAKDALMEVRGAAPAAAEGGGADEPAAADANADAGADTITDAGADAGADAEAAPPLAKRPKKAKPAPLYTMNINNAVDKEYEDCSLQDIASAPTSALQGVAEKGKLVLRKFGVKTIAQLGRWKFYKVAKAIAGLAELEEKDARPEGAALNLNKALVKKHETKSLQEILALPPSALEGLAGWGDAELATLHIKTVAQLGDWKFARWSESIADLADFESTDFSS